MFSAESDLGLKLLSEKLYHLKTIGQISTAKVSNSSTKYHSNGYQDNWSCGYQNTKTLLSSIQLLHQYSRLFLADPDISTLQAYLESAWAAGFDPDGCQTFNGSIIGKHDWIGTTEVAALLCYLGIKYNNINTRVKCYDFHYPSGPNKTHPLLFEIVEKYFNQTLNDTQSFPTVNHDDILTNLPSIYLQHQGHSRSIVGYLKTNDEMKLIIYDPGRSKINSKDDIDQICLDITQLTHDQYSILTIDGLLDVNNDNEREIAKSLGFHINLPLLDKDGRKTVQHPLSPFFSDKEGDGIIVDGVLI
jgi:hypothetical protein